jgi:hypothetical protein
MLKVVSFLTLVIILISGFGLVQAAGVSNPDPRTGSVSVTALPQATQPAPSAVQKTPIQPVTSDPSPDSAIHQVASRGILAPQACTINWTGGNGAWTDSTHWDLHRQPFASDTVCIPGTSSGPTVTVSTSVVGVASLNVSGVLQITTGGVLPVSGATTVAGLFSLQNGAFQDNGSMTITGVMNWAGGSLVNNNLQDALRINGTLNLSASSSLNGRIDLYGSLVQSGATALN